MYLVLVGCCGGALAVVIGRAAPSRVENNAVVFILHVLKDLCCIGSLASQAALRDRLIGTGADKHGAANYRGNMHGITRTFTRIGLTAAGAVAAAVAVAVALGKGNGHFLQTLHFVKKCPLPLADYRVD